MSFSLFENIIAEEDGVEASTMMKSPCIRYRGKFLAMIFDRQDALIIKVSEERVNELIAEGKGRAFNFTKKRFKEWVLIDLNRKDELGDRVLEALQYAKGRE